MGVPVPISVLPPNLAISSFENDFNLALRFLEAELDPRITVSRASTKTYFGADGKLTTAAAHELPLEYDPVTLAPVGRSVWESRTNLLTYSEQFDNAAWVKSNAAVTPNTITAPDGTLTADKLVENTVNASHYVLQSGLSAANDGTYTLSFFAKAGERSAIQVEVSGNSGPSGWRVVFNLTAVTATGVGIGAPVGTGSQSIRHVDKGWYLCTVTATPGSTGNTSRSALIALHNGTTTAYTGDGTSGIYIWGAQLEAGAFATPYIPTTPTFTSRASTATYFDANGLMQTAGVNVARNGYGLVNGQWVSQGLILEAAGTNLQTRSEEVNLWGFISASVSSNSTVAPDGLSTADVVIEDTTANNTHHVLAPSVSFVNGTTYTASVFLKAAGRSRCALALSGYDNWTGGTGAECVFNLSTKTATWQNTSGVAKSIEDIGNGWFRCSITAVRTGADGTAQFVVLLDNGTTTIYTGDGTSGIYIWGAQLEVGPVATSYIKTEGTTITRAADVSSSVATSRAADVVTMTGANFSDWYNQTEGTFVADIRPTVLAAGTAVETNNNTSSERVHLRANAGGAFVVVDGGATQAAFGTASSGKISAGYKANDFAFSFNGGAVSTDVSGALPTPDRMFIGSRSTGAEYLNGHIRSITYYPKRLSNAQLQALSA